LKRSLYHVIISPDTMSSISFSAKVVGFTAVCCAVAATIEIPRAHQNLLDIEAAWKLLEEGGRVVTDVGDKLSESLTILTN